MTKRDDLRCSKKLTTQRHVDRFPTKTENFKDVKSIQNHSTSLNSKFDGVNQLSQNQTNPNYENFEEKHGKNVLIDSNLVSYSNDLNGVCHKTCNG